MTYPKAPLPDDVNETLSQALGRHGISHSKAKLDGRQSLNHGVLRQWLGDYTSEEAWQLVHDLDNGIALNDATPLHALWKINRSYIPCANKKCQNGYIYNRESHLPAMEVCSECSGSGEIEVEGK